MSNRLKYAVLFGIGMTFVFCTMSFVDILKGEDETTAEIARSFAGALGAGLFAGVLMYVFYNKTNADKLFGK